MRDRDTDSVSFESLYETERHKRMVAEQAKNLAEARIAAAAIYLESLGFSPLKAMVLKILRGEEVCKRCGGTRDSPRTLTDDSYSVFPCPWPFHYD